MGEFAPQAEPLAMRHLRLWLGALDRTIAAAVDRQNTLARALAHRPLSPHAITPEHAIALAEQGARFLRAGYAALPDIALRDDERTSEAALAALARERGAVLPLERLERETHLAPHEHAALIIVAAAEMSSAHERLYAYLVDDLGRAHASIELILLLTAGASAAEPIRRQQVGAAGVLRRLGLIVAADGAASTARTVLRLGSGVLDWLSGAQMTPPMRLSDPDQNDNPEHCNLPAGEETAIAIALLAAGNGCVGIWGDGDRAVLAEGLAAAAGRRLRRLTLSHGADSVEAVAAQVLALAAGTDAIAWVEIDSIPGFDMPGYGDRIAVALASRSQPIIVSGREPWRPLTLLRDGQYAELGSVPVESHTASQSLAVRLSLDEETASTLSGRYRFTTTQERTLAALAKPRIEHGIAGIDRAARMVAATASCSHAVLIEPQRGPDDLVLPEPLHRQVVEIAEFFVAAPAVDERWGFGRLSASPGGLKALFTGDPGTGKTLAAEVVAYQLGRQLMKVDLAQVVSKWVGETEKNLQVVFDAAENAAAVLFFDEADTLFGKRGEVRHGTDRYANLEVGYLLQRIETYRGLVILASNLRDEIDSAFLRRFQILLHFPRPSEVERRRLWQLALAHAEGAPADLDWDALVRLDLTGAGIMSSARLAALLSATQGDERPTIAHVREAIARQFRQEARLLRGQTPIVTASRASAGS
jgi:hypothetical protein